MKLKHLLLTIDLRPQRAHLHGYLMHPEQGMPGLTPRALIDGAINRMMEAAQKISPEWVLPIVLCTELSTGKKLVRNIVRKQTPKLLHAKQYYFGVWVSDAESRDDAQLMQLH